MGAASAESRPQPARVETVQGAHEKPVGPCGLTGLEDVQREAAHAPGVDDLHGPDGALQVERLGREPGLPVVGRASVCDPT